MADIKGAWITDKSTVTELAVNKALQIAADNTHGYDQRVRWGPDYDCSSLIISCYRAAGVPLDCSYTGDMRGSMLRHGFADVTARVSLSGGAWLVRGDVLLNCARHTALYIGNGQLVQASANEHGAATGGVTGDQTGREIAVRAYYNYPWDCVLRYAPDDDAREENKTPRTAEIALPIITAGTVSAAVGAMQGALRVRGYDPVWVDGEYGDKTRAALTAFQTAHGLAPDGVCGAASWAALVGEGVRG